MYGEIQERKQSENKNFILKAPMLPLNYLLTGLQKILESLIKCLPQMEFYLI